MQPDSIIPDLSNPQSWNRYSYVKNAPTQYTDPSGHKPIEDEFNSDASTGNKNIVENKKNDNNQGKNKKDNSEDKLCKLIPVLCKWDDKNPLNYDTIGLIGEYDLKFAGGLEFKPYVYVDGKSFRNFEWMEMDVAIGFSLEVSVGLSAMDAVGVTITGSDGSVLEQHGIGGGGNLGGCVMVVGFCPKVAGSYSLDEKELTSISYSGLFGTGFDLSYGTSYTEHVFYQKGNDGWIKIPFFQKYFPFTND